MATLAFLQLDKPNQLSPVVGWKHDWMWDALCSILVGEVQGPV
jgi:hypothetical protein